MADYGPQDTSTTTLGANQFPISEAWTPNAGFSAVEGGVKTTDSGGKKSAPVRMEVKDGSNLVEGATTDAAVTGDNSGTLSAKLRGLTKIFTDIWDSVNHRIKVDGSGVTQPVSGTVTSNQGGTWTVQPGNTANTTPWLMQDVAAITGGSTPSHTMSAASTNATSLKGSAGMVYGLSISNNNAAARYFKLYNKAAAPTVGTDTPVLTLQVPANGTVIRAYPVGLALGTGIAWAATGAITDADTTAIGANDLSIDIDYK